MSSDESVLIDIGRRIPKLDTAIVALVFTLVAIDLAIIQDPLHTFLGLLMVPAARRVLRGFHAVRVLRRTEGLVIETTFLRQKAIQIPEGSNVEIDRRRTLWGVPLVHVRVDREEVCAIGHHCNPDELDQLSELLS